MIFTLFFRRSPFSPYLILSFFQIMTLVILSFLSFSHDHASSVISVYSDTPVLFGLRLHTGCIKEFSEVENYIENVMETTNPIGKFYTLKSVIELKVFLAVPFIIPGNF